MVSDILVGDIEPEWKTDGFGLRGEQVEPADDDDLVWDTDVWTRLNPEQDSIAGAPTPPPPCPTITLTCDQISAGLSKCGFEDDDTDHFYLTHILTLTAGSDACPPPFNGCFCGSITYTFTAVLGLDFNCTFPDYVCTGGGLYFDSVACDGLCTPANLSALCLCSGAPFDCHTGFSDPCVTTTHTFLNEYTTADLISNVISILPAYDDDFNDDCFASRALIDDTSYTIFRFNPKFTIEVQTTDTVICYNEHFVPSVGAPVDTPKIVTIPAGDTFIIGDEVLEPSANGTTTITDVTCCPT